MKSNPVYGHSHTTAPSSLIRVPMGVSGKPGKASWKVVRVGGSGQPVSPGVFGVPLAPTPNVVATNLRAPSDAHVEAALLGLPNNGTAPYCASYADWITFGLALYGATGGSREDLWDDWCAAQPQVKRDPAHAWASFHSTTVGWPKLHWMVREYGFPHLLAGVVFDDGVVGAAASGGTPRAKQLKYAEAIAEMYGSAMRYNLDRKAWAEFDGQVWRQLSPVVKLAAQYSIGMAKRAPPRDKGDHDIMALGFHDGVEGLCRQFPELQAREADFDSDPMLLGTPKGTVDLKTGALVQSRASDLISKSTVAVPAAGCPRWMKFLHEVTLGDKESMLFLQQYAGYCLTGSTKEEMFLFLHGPGKNGKSKFADTLAFVMGDYFTKPVGDLFVQKAHGTGHTSKLAMLSGARLCTISEVPVDARWDEVLLKDVTGGGKITAGFKHVNEFSFDPQFKLLAYGNHQPAFPGGIDESIRRRFWLMEFKFTADPPDPDLFGKLKAEAAGILAWAIEGCLSWQKMGLLKPRLVEKASRAFFTDQDLLGRWKDERVVKKPGGFVSAKDLFTDWTEWRNAQGEHHILENSNNFSKEVVKRGLVPGRTETSRGYKDIALNDKAADAFNDEVSH
jgi:putative DNA primase/helicase